ncbi:MAG: DUF2162 domain-containing protein [Deltaproteobacteria bacterium]|nr:DUF2162 domain-containing protein [Deltaproteobacteria bacterium]
MELQTLLTGLMVAVLAFAVKTGLGWAYLWLGCRPGRRAAATLGVLGLYALVFGGLFWLVSRVDLLAGAGRLAPLWRGGLALHWLTAGLTFLWGLALLKGGSGAAGCRAGGSRGWLALALPCPVCLSVLAMSAACLEAYFPEKALLGLGLVYVGFAAVAAVSGLTFILGRGASGAAAGRSDAERSQTERSSLERSLGQAMMLVAAYFMVSALVLPNFGEVARIYRLAAHASAERPGLGGGVWGVLAASLGLIAAGFFSGRRGARRSAGPARRPAVRGQE